MADSGIMPAAEVGGLYGINVETLGDNKTLTPGSDKIYQYLDEGGADRIITLATATATAGNRFVIRHNGSLTDGHFLEVKQAAASLDKIYSGAIKEFIFDGTDWVSRGVGTGEDDTRIWNVAVGSNANASTYGSAVGYKAKADTYGAAVGYETDASFKGAALGYQAKAYINAVAVGYQATTDSKWYSIALGYKSKCIRYGETSINIDGDGGQKNNVVQGRWSGSTANDTPAEIFCGGVANERFTIRPSSALAFRLIIVARDNVAGEVARYSVRDGLIERDAAGNTTMVLCTVTVDHEDDATWDVAVTADDGNDALIITVTGDADNPVQWAAVMDGVETHF
ncbi:hypothetical protein ES703_45173 [subsurface metagenome]